MFREQAEATLSCALKNSGTYVPVNTDIQNLEDIDITNNDSRCVPSVNCIATENTVNLNKGITVDNMKHLPPRERGNTKFPNPNDFWMKYKIEKVPADGHCFVHAVVAAISSQLSQHKPVTKYSLLHSIEKEVIDNLDAYSLYLDNYLSLSENSDINSTYGETTDRKAMLKDQLYRYLNDYKWATELGHMIPEIVAKCLNINIVIVSKSESTESIQFTCVPGASTDDYVYVYFHSHHYDSLSCMPAPSIHVC